VKENVPSPSPTPIPTPIPSANSATPTGSIASLDIFVEEFRSELEGKSSAQIWADYQEWLSKGVSSASPTPNPTAEPEPTAEPFESFVNGAKKTTKLIWQYLKKKWEIFDQMRRSKLNALMENDDEKINELKELGIQRAEIIDFSNKLPEGHRYKSKLAKMVEEIDARVDKLTPKSSPMPQRTPPITQQEAEIETTDKQKDDSMWAIIVAAVSGFLMIPYIVEVQGEIAERNRLRREKRAAKLLDRRTEEEDIAAAPESEYLQRRRREEEIYRENNRKLSKMYIPLHKIVLLPPGGALLPPQDIPILVQLTHLLRVVLHRLPNVIGVYEDRLNMLLNWLNPQAIPVARQIINNTNAPYDNVPAMYPNANMYLRYDGATDNDPNYYREEHRDGTNTTFIEGIALPPEEVRHNYEVEEGEELIARQNLRLAYLRRRLRTLEEQLIDTNHRLERLQTFNTTGEYDRDMQIENEGDQILLEEEEQELLDEIESIKANIQELMPIYDGGTKEPDPLDFY
jgi:hypothetical protein